MTDRFKTYDSALKWLYFDLPTSEKQIFGGQKSLDVSGHLLSAVGNPQDKYPTVHVAGTSGKGSTVALAASILQANGRRVGTILSPHVYDFRERFMVNGQFVSKKETLKSINQLVQVIEKLNTEQIFPSYYQSVVALSYLVFSRHGLDYLVIETGFGGLYDTTNLITRNDKVVLLNSIGLDHTQILGNTLEKIAHQKAGIISEHSVVFALNQSENINHIFREQAKIRGAKRFELVEKIGQDEDLILSVQTNLALAAAACKYLAFRDKWSLTGKSIISAGQDFSLPGRFEVRPIAGKIVIFDGAHNTQKVQMLAQNMATKYPNEKFNILFASSKSRSPKMMFEILAPIAKRFYLTSYSAFEGDSLRGSIDFSEYDGNPESSIVVEDSVSAIKLINESIDNWLVTGSFFLVSDVGSVLKE